MLTCVNLLCRKSFQFQQCATLSFLYTNQDNNYDGFVRTAQVKHVFPKQQKNLFLKKSLQFCRQDVLKCAFGTISSWLCSEAEEIGYNTVRDTRAR